MCRSPITVDFSLTPHDTLHKKREVEVRGKVANAKVRLLKNVKLDQQDRTRWKFCPVATNAKGKYKLGHVRCGG